MLAAISHPDSATSSGTKKLEDYCLKILVPLQANLMKVGDSLNADKFKAALRSDKKNTEDSLCLVLPASSTQLAKVYLPFELGSIDVAYDVVLQIFSRFKTSKS
jgi:hypothetical protein